MAEIALSRGLVALVDDEDLPALSIYPWYAAKDPSLINGIRFYARRAGRHGETNTICMHRQIMRPAPGLVVDHISGDGLDNRRANLRVCLPFENARNKIAGYGKSGLKGVYPRPSGRWQSAVKVDGKLKWLGTFGSPEEAARAYDCAALLHYGAFARPNFPEAA